MMEYGVGEADSSASLRNDSQKGKSKSKSKGKGKSKGKSKSKSEKAKRQELMQGLSTALATPSGKDARWGPGSLRSR